MYLGIQDIVPEGSCWEKPSICLRFFFSCRLSASRIMGVGRTLLILHYDLARRKYVTNLRWVLTKKPWLLITVWELNVTFNHLRFFDKVP